MADLYSKDPVVNRSLRHSVRDGGYYSVMAGAGESYFAAFAIFLKANTAQIGFLASVPPLLASFAQLFSAWLGHKTGKRKAIILWGAFLQSLTLIPLALIPIWMPEYAVSLMIACVILYYAFGNFAVPQWSSLMGDLVEEQSRGRYFASRTRIASLVAFGALLISGFLLHFFDESQATLTGYLLIFAIAFIARLISVYHLSQMYDPPGHVAAMEVPVNKGNWVWLKDSQFLRFSLFFTLIQFSVSVASPFFSLYLLRDLHFSYMEFMAISASVLLMQFLTLTGWGKISDQFGNRVILTFCGSLIPVIPLLWLFSSNFYYLLFTQALSGLVWAGFTLSVGNFLYELIPSGKRATFLAVHNVSASVGIFFGALLGGYLGATLPESFSFLGYEIDWETALYNVFIISFLMRAITAALFLPKLKEVRVSKQISITRLIFRVNRFNPLTGIFFDIVGSRKKNKRK
ncbi:MAG: MFS transporter [Gammaproteobacteria bacterium]|nr:MFS transporter [Gammaproteobacteria bacterium]